MTGNGSRAERWVATRWPAIHARGRWRFVLVRGVAIWGGVMFAAMAALMAYRFGIHHPRLPLLVGIALPLCAVGGLAWGLLTWFLNERIYHALTTSKDIP